MLNPCCVGASRYASVSFNASAGVPLLLEAVGAAVIGGTSPFGGRGSVWNAILGALVIVARQRARPLRRLGRRQRRLELRHLCGQRRDPAPFAEVVEQTRRRNRSFACELREPDRMDGLAQIPRQVKRAHLLQSIQQTLHAHRTGGMRECSQPCQARTSERRVVLPFGYLLRRGTSGDFGRPCGAMEPVESRPPRPPTALPDEDWRLQRGTLQATIAQCGSDTRDFTPGPSRPESRSNHAGILVKCSTNTVKCAGVRTGPTLNRASGMQRRGEGDHRQGTAETTTVAEPEGTAVAGRSTRLCPARGGDMGGVRAVKARSR